MAKMADNANCIIGEGSIFEGRFYIEGSIRIDGKFQGEIKTGDQLIIAPTGKVKTNIIARRVTIAGTLIGNITASDEVNLIETGKVLGDIVTPKLTVEPGVITEGKITITSNASENVGNIINESYGEETDSLFDSLSTKTNKGYKKAESD